MAGFRILPFAVDHQDPKRAGGPLGGNLGYSIKDREGFKVVLSGDTRPCDTLEQEVEGADIAVLEASARDQDLQKAIEHRHMTKSEAERIGRRAKKVIYIHRPQTGMFEITTTLWWNWSQTFFRDSDPQAMAVRT